MVRIKIRRRIAAACVIISSLVVLVMVTSAFAGRGNIHAVSAIAYGSVSVAAGLAYLRSTGRRS
jgi:hypothetical protein